MEIEVGEYIRTKKGFIAKVCAYQDLTTYDNKGISVTFHSFDTDKGAIADIKVAKHSKSIIDLIEVGDYVNGILITGKESTLLYTEINGIDGSGYHIPISQYGENIKSIVTKEQIKQIECKIEEENE